ncbi:unnamed protein product [Tilletia controversa]|nr:unnamed protein product [Tilletia controversa]CAD6925171.1 unnamed protein product [Tilletia controversa]
MSTASSSSDEHESSGEDEGSEADARSADVDMDMDNGIEMDTGNNNDTPFSIDPDPNYLPDYRRRSPSPYNYENADDSDDDGDQIADLPPPTLDDDDFHPFPSKVIFLVHSIAFNSRCSLSVAQVKLILLLLRWLGFNDAPSYDKYKQGVSSAMKATSATKERVTDMVGREYHRFSITKITE